MSRPSRHVVWEQFVLFELCLLSTSKWMQNLGKSRVPDIAWYAVFYCLLNVWLCIMGVKRKDFVLITIWWVNFNCRAPRSSQVISVMRVMMDLDETFQQLYILLKVHVPVAFCMYLSLWTFLVRENCMKDWCQLSFRILSLQLQNLKPILRFTQLMRKCPYTHLQSILQSFANVDSNCSYCWALVGLCKPLLWVDSWEWQVPNKEEIRIFSLCPLLCIHF